MCVPLDWLLSGISEVFCKYIQSDPLSPRSNANQFFNSRVLSLFWIPNRFSSRFTALWHKLGFIWTVNVLWSANDSKAFLSSRFSQLLLFCLPYHSIIGMLIELLFSFERIHYENLSSKGLPVSKKTTCISNLIYHLHLLKYHLCDIYSSSFNDLRHFPIPYSFTLSIW